MEEFDVLYFGAIAVATVIIVILDIASLSLGKLIDDTPDGRELRGENVKRDGSMSSPRLASRIFTLVLSTLFIIGVMVLVLANGSKVMMIAGGVLMFAVLLFAATIVVFELMIYNTMRERIKNTGVS